ncbi:MAG: fumarylacetoacetate hydrolase family protein [Syntrophomonadaceae bacterium]|jgi:2-keto-4-pentenoate hydratase/2-oxohepta-3-ene-1,7-dioic acid hydratase in catechol pathway
MKFITYKYQETENVGVLMENKVVPLEGLGFPVKSMLELIETATDDMVNKIENIISTGNFAYLPFNLIKLLPPIPYPKRNVFCLGKNYADHAREIKITQISDTGIPERPIYFTKVASPAIGSGDLIKFSRQTTSQVDYEVELAVVIGRDGINIRPEEAQEYIFGYTIVNDVSARDLQADHKQWFKGKSLDTFCPMGPCIVHKNYIQSPMELNIKCTINGEVRQNSNTSNMIFDIPYIISDLSRGMTLIAGDIICTGTPSGVGMGFNPPKLLNDGDIVDCYIENIGTLTNIVAVN